MFIQRENLVPIDSLGGIQQQYERQNHVYLSLIGQ